MRFAGKVFPEAIQELEAWLLIDCLGIFCYFASKRAQSQYRDDCRSKVSENPKRLVGYRREIRNHAEIGGKGAKEHLIEFSEKILLALNPNMPLKNVDREKYRETRSSEVAEHIVIDKETLQRNNSLKKLGDVIAKFQ